MDVSQTKSSRRLIRLVIKEELVELCRLRLMENKTSVDPFTAAIVLQQMLFWSERVGDFDKFIEEENKRAASEGLEKKELYNGWIYKSGKELETELMEFKKESTINRALEFLTQQGWLSKRSNPVYKWDKTSQYRLNLLALQVDLQKIGYNLEGYKALNNPFPTMGDR